MGITLLSGPIGLKFRCAMCYFGLGPMPVAAVVPAYFLLTPHRSRPLALRRQAWQAVAVAILVLLVAAPTLAIAHFTGSEVQFLFNAFWAGAFLINIGCAATAWFRPAFKLPLLGNWVMGILEWTDRPVPSGTMPLSFSISRSSSSR